MDDYRLLIRLGPTADTPPSLVLVDTGKDVRGVPVQTFFLLAHFLEGLAFTLDRGAHKPSPAESLAPFHHDPTRRIVALDMRRDSCRLVFRVEVLLELLKVREGTRIGWDEWKHHAVIPSIAVDNRVVYAVRVSGCRLFFICSKVPSLGFRMEMFDFSMQGRTKHLSERASGFGVLKHLSPTAIVQNPQDILFDGGAHSGHDSIIFLHVSYTNPLFPLERD